MAVLSAWMMGNSSDGVRVAHLAGVKEILMVEKKVYSWAVLTAAMTAGVKAGMTGDG
jgi:hypothetical protein